MAFYEKTWPVGLAPGMVLMFVAFGVVAGMGYTPSKLWGLLVAGVLFLDFFNTNKSLVN